MRTKLFIPLILLSMTTFGQIINPKETVKRKTEDRTNRGIDRSLDKGLDKVEEGIGSIFKKKNKEESKKEEPSKSGKNKADKQNKNEERDPASEEKEDTAASSKKTLKSYSKFDFIPGEKVIGTEDFLQDAVGDFPAKWNTNGSGEIVKIDGVEGNWLMVNSTSVFYPEFIGDLPENATLEFDMAVSENYSEMQSGLKFWMLDKSVRNAMFNQYFEEAPQVGIDIHPYGADEEGGVHVWVRDKTKQKVVENSSTAKGWKSGEVNRISIWKQKTRFRMYINEVKVWDLPRAFDPSVTYQLIFGINPFSGSIYLSNLRVASGAPDTRNKLITEGKFVTRGITFDVNSDKIKPESYGVLKEIATVLKENNEIKVQIVGHTDSDGDEKFNLALSEKRAAAVKNVLNAEFGISAERMETLGKGESEPSEPNTTPQGKANNRRVEFIKR
jgi:OOP family OmpA-OmpF porin